MLEQKQLAALQAFFPEKTIQWKPGPMASGKTLAMPYLEARDVMRRLDEAVNGNWEFDWEPIGNEVKGTLTVCGMTRCDVGEKGSPPYGDTTKAAVSDALKRCGVHFGIGRYLYYVDPQWVAYDEAKKRITETPRLPKWAIPTEDTTETAKAHWSADPETIIKAKARAANDLSMEGRDVDRLIPDWTIYATKKTAWAYLKQHAGPPEEQQEAKQETDALETLRTKIRKDALNDETPAEEGHRGKAQGSIEALFVNIKDKDVKTNMRHLLTGWMIDKPSSRGDNGWTRGECYQLITWAASQDGSAPRAEAIAQAQQIVERVETEAGQQKLEV